MKNLKLPIILILSLLAVVSCSSEPKDKPENKDSVVEEATEEVSPILGESYAGVYKLPSEDACKISITIEGSVGNYTYKIIDDGTEYTGQLIVENQDSEIYLSFNGQIEDNAPKTVSGQLIDGAIVIQNYGNAMNEFVIFKNCDSKYLEFKK